MITNEKNVEKHGATSTTPAQGKPSEKGDSPKANFAVKETDKNPIGDKNTGEIRKDSSQEKRA